MVNKEDDYKGKPKVVLEIHQILESDCKAMTDCSDSNGVCIAQVFAEQEQAS